MIRSLTEEELPIVRGWWQKRKLPPPDIGMMPRVTTFAYFEDDHPRVSVSIFMTNASVAWLDNFISDPTWKSSERQSIAKRLLQFCANVAKWAGKNRLFCMSDRPSTARYYRSLGFEQTAEVITMVKGI